MGSAFHPDYGYTDAFRLKVCKTALRVGKKRAAQQHKVSLCSVYTWIKVYSLDAIKRA